MAGSNINQNIFNYGELSPELGGATDSELYNHGLEYCLNARIGTLGGIYKREGSCYIHRYVIYGKGKASGSYVRDLYSFYISKGVSYVLAISPYCIELFDIHKRIVFVDVDWLTPEILNSGYSCFQFGDDMYLFTKYGMYVLRYNQVDTTLAVERLDFTFAPVSLFNNDESRYLKIRSILGNTVTIDANFDNAFHDSDVGQNIRMSWQVTREAEQAQGKEMTITCFAYFRITFVFADGKKIEAEYLPEKSTIGTDTTLLPKPYYEIYDFSLPIFGEGRGGYPTKACVFKGRLWIIDNANFYILASRVNYDNILDFYQYAVKEGATESSIIYDFNPSCGAITWIAPIVDKLIIGTLDGLYMSNGRTVSSDKLVTLSSLSFVKVSSIQCGFARPAVINSAVIFSDYEGRLLYEVAVNDMSGMYDVNEISMASRHILNAGIAGTISYTTYPYNLIACPLKDGMLAVMTYSRGNEVYGWTRVELGGGGHVESCASLKYKGRDYITICVSRIKNGNLERTIEYFSNKFIAKPDDVLEHHYVDSGIEYANKGTITNVTTARDAQIKFDSQLTKEISGDNIYILSKNNNKMYHVCSRSDFDCRSLTHIIYLKTQSDKLDAIAEAGDKVFVYENSLRMLGIRLCNYHSDGDDILYLYSPIKLRTDFIRTVFAIYDTEYDEDTLDDVITTSLQEVKRLAIPGTYRIRDKGYIYNLASVSEDGERTIRIDEDVDMELEVKDLIFLVGEGSITAGRYLSINYKLQDKKHDYHFKQVSSFNVSKYNPSRIQSIIMHEDTCSFNTSSVRVCYNNEVPIPDDIKEKYPNIKILATKSFHECYCASNNILLKITYNAIAETNNVEETFVQNDDFVIDKMFLVSGNAFFLSEIDNDNGSVRLSYFQDEEMQNDLWYWVGSEDKILYNVYYSGGAILTKQYIIWCEGHYFVSRRHELGETALSIYRGDEKIFIGGKSGVLYQLNENDDNGTYRILHNQKFDIVKITVNDDKLVCLSSIGEVLEFDLKGDTTKDDNNKTIEYKKRKLTYIKSIGHSWYLHSIQDDKHICVVNSGILSEFITEAGYTNILDEQDNVFIKDIKYMPSINKQQLFKVYYHIIDNNDGTGLILFDRFPGDSTASEAYDKALIDNGEIYFPIDNVPNLSRFDGEKLRVVVNGYDIGDKKVTNNHIMIRNSSDIFLSHGKSFIAHVGYPYNHLWRTLDLSGGSVKGSSVGLIAQQHTLCCQILCSRGGEYSVDGIKWYPIIYSYITDKSLDHPHGLYTGKIKLVMPNSSVDITARKVWFRHNTAEPFNVLSITRDTYVSDI